MSVTDTDYSILMTKLSVLEQRVKVLEDSQRKPQPDKDDYTIKGHTPYITYEEILRVL